MLDDSKADSEVDGISLIRDSVFNMIREDILSCELAPGSFLQEKELVALYKVSKSPIRDALLRLQEQGLIIVLPRKGYKVPPISLTDAKELYETRIILEQSCIRRAIEFAHDEDLESLDKFRHTQQDNNLAGWTAYNRKFHRAVAKLSGNTRLAKITRDIIDQFDRLTSLGVSTPPNNVSSQMLVAEHCDLIDALQARDRNRSKRLIKDHITKSRKRLLAVLENPPIVE